MLNKISTCSLLKVCFYLCLVIVVIYFCLSFLETKDLDETSFSYHQTRYQKYEVNESVYPNFGYKTGKVIHISNYQEYQSLLNKYEIINNQELNENDFEENNYLYVIVGETACPNDFQYEGYFESGGNVTLKFTYANCACYVSSLRVRAYQILISKDLTKTENYNISFIQNNSNDICSLT